MVNIEGLNKAKVLQVLFNKSKIQGFNAQRVKMGMMEYPKDLTVEEAQAILDDIGEDKWFDYLNEKVMKVNLSSDEEFNESSYDRDNGTGAAQDAINILRGVN